MEHVFTHAGESWTREEDNKLNKLYNVDMLDVIEISKIHDRAPGGIISRLAKKGYVTEKKLARGYADYKNCVILKKSHTITHFVGYHKKQDEINPPTPLDELSFIDNPDIAGMQNDMKELKNEVAELKNTIKQLVDMMNSVYEFEDV